jgi:tetratricopeptide (TPR) repeat protein/type IV secretory pathway TrbD component
MKVEGSAPRRVAVASRQLAFVPAAITMAVLAGLLTATGGFFEREWMPAGIGLGAVALAAALGSARILAIPRGSVVALAALWALTAWLALSMLWADSPGRAWNQSALFLTTALVVTLLTLAPWRTASADMLFGAFALSVTIVCGFELASAVAAEELTGRFLEDRWADPLGYPNGTAALAVMGALVALVLSARPDRHWALRGPALGMATFLAGFAVLPQSRGAVIGAALGVAAALALGPARWRLLVRLAIVGAAVALAARPAFDVYGAASAEQPIGPALAETLRLLVVGGAAATVTGLVLAWVEGRVRLGRRGQRVSQLAGVAFAVLALVALLTAAIGQADRIERELRGQWASFTQPAPSVDGELDEAGSVRNGNRLLDTDPLQRYDYWRVSLDGFADAPLLGLAAGGFADRYTAERRHQKHSRYPHNLTLRVLGEAGVVGALLVLALVGAVAAGLARRVRTMDAGQRGVTAAAVAMAVAFSAHAQFDWLEAFPVLLGPAIAFPLVALVAASAGSSGPVWVRIPRPALAAAAALLVLGVGGVASQWLAVRYRDRAAQNWPADPAVAYRDLDRAARLNPLGATPRMIEGVIALNRRDLVRARQAFAQAIEREDPWLAHFELALVAALEDDRAEALEHLERARSRNPLEPALDVAERRLRRGRPIDPEALNGQLLESPLFLRRRLI